MQALANCRGLNGNEIIDPTLKGYLDNPNIIAIYSFLPVTANQSYHYKIKPQA